jgi:hypothetical protein
MRLINCPGPNGARATSIAMAPLRPSTAAHPGGAAGRRAGIWQHNLSRALVPVLLPTLARVIALVMMLINTLAGPRLREGVLLAEQVLVHGISRHPLYLWIGIVAACRVPVGPATKKVNSLIVIHKNNTNSTHNNINTQQSQQRKTVTHNNNHHTQPLQQKEHNNNTQNTLAN